MLTNCLRLQHQEPGRNLLSLGQHLALPARIPGGNQYLKSSSGAIDMLSSLMTTELNEEMDVCRIPVADGDDATRRHRRNTEVRRDSAESIHAKASHGR